MASAREDAKNSIVTRATDDPELQETLTSAHRLQLAMAQEKNRHAEAMRGWFGRALGPSETAPTNIAFIGMMSGLAAMAACFAGASGSGADAISLQFWTQWGERAIGFSATCLAFIFGKGWK